MDARALARQGHSYAEIGRLLGRDWRTVKRYLETDTASAEERVKLFHLAWDTCCSAFASRQVLYERFFQGDRYRNVVLLNELYDKTPMTNWVRDFLDDV